MADAPDFRNDPEYIKTRDEMDKTHRRKNGWLGLNLASVVAAGVLVGAAALELGAFAVEAGTLGLGTPVAVAMAVGGAALVGVAFYAKHKYTTAAKDDRMAKSEATAQRTGYYVSQALQQQHEQELAEASDPGFRARENARRAQQAAAATR